jgi:PAS domain S-box-containing protein
VLGIRELKGLSRYWLTIGAIALLCGMTTSLSGFATLHLMQPAALAAIQTQPVVWQAAQWAVVVSSLFSMLIVAIALGLVLGRQDRDKNRLQAIFAGAAIGIGLDSLDGTIVESNPALQSMVGYSRDELAQMTFDKFTHPDDLATDVELFREMINGQRESYQIEKRYIHRNGTPLWIRLTNSVVKNNQGAPEYTIAVAEDITLLKQAQTALQQSEDRFQLVAETATCAFLVYQGDHFRYVNRATEQITGYSRDELLKMNFWDLAHPDYRKLVRDRGLARQRGETVPRRYEMKIVTKLGHQRWIDIIGGSVHLDGQPAALATAYDITDRKQAEAELQLAANRDRLLSEVALRIRGSLSLEEILNTTVAEVRRFLNADRVFIAGLEVGGGCQAIAESVDPQWKSMLGWVMGDEAAEEIRQLLRSGAAKSVDDTSLAEKTPFLEDYYSRCQVQACLGIPIMVNGELFGILAVNQCSAPRQWQPFEMELITRLSTQVEIAIQQGKLYQQLRALTTNLECQVEERTLELHQRMQELQHSNQIKDLLLHAVSHDLRTPVQGTLMVLNHLCSCNDRPVCDSIQVPRSLLERMIVSSDRQLSLLDCLIDNHAADSYNHSLLKREPVTLQPIINLAIALVEPKLHKNNARVTEQISADLPTFYADSAKLQCVIANLLCNAVTHNPPGVTITLTAKIIEDKAERKVEDRKQPREGKTQHLYFTVEDDGEGMRQEQCDRLFQLYVRGIDNQHLTGIGLGLHRCQRIIAAHNGAIGVESRLGAGSKFWFTLPLESKYRDGQAA